MFVIRPKNTVQSEHLSFNLATIIIIPYVDVDCRQDVLTLFTCVCVFCIAELLSNKTHDGEYNISAVVKVLLHLLPQTDEQEAESLVGGALACYKRLHPLKKDRTLLLQVLLAATHITNPTLWR